MDSRKPEIVVYAGPNGSGKSTFVNWGIPLIPFINADEIKKNIGCTDLEAAIMASKTREELVRKNESFSFVTVLSTERNLLLLRKAKEKGFFIRCIYVITRNPSINTSRVNARVEAGGHNVPFNKVISRYYKSINNIAELVSICDICHIYDNSKEVPFRIFKKRKDETFIWENSYWSLEKIKTITKT